VAKRWVRVSFALLFAASAIGACSVDRADMATSSCTGLSCRDVANDGPPTDVGGTAAAPDASTSSSPPPPLLKVVCGGGSCVPEDARSCANFSPEQPIRNSGGETDAGPGVEADGGAGLDAGVSDAGVDTRVDGSFTRPTTPEAAPSAYACQLSLNRSNRVVRSCVPAGVRKIDEACTSSLDCEPGLGCVGSVRAGRCLPYCCGIDGDTCEEGYYCAKRHLRTLELGEADGPEVPVCDRAENCSLGEPANCTGEHCVCSTDTACSVVRPDGTTACVDQGENGAGEPCPCKWGYVCSQGTTPPSCVKTCELNALEQCGSGVCQSTPLLPEGWGTCVGTPSAPMP